MRRSISLFLLLALTVCLFSGCIYTDSPEHEQTPETQTEQVTETTEAPTPSLWMSFSDDTTTYYCWEDGSATTTKEWNPGFYTWTKPWNGEFYNIYNGSSATGRVLYSERSCDWCDKHLVYYYTFIRCGDTLEGNYLCESCHDELRAFYNRCSVCDYYYVQYNEENHTDMCDYCAGY